MPRHKRDGGAEIHRDDMLSPEAKGLYRAPKSDRWRTGGERFRSGKWDEQRELVGR